MPDMSGKSRTRDNLTTDATSRLALSSMYYSPGTRTGCAWRITHICGTNKQQQRSWRVISTDTKGERMNVLRQCEAFRTCRSGFPITTLAQTRLRSISPLRCATAQYHHTICAVKIWTIKLWRHFLRTPPTRGYGPGDIHTTFAIEQNNDVIRFP